MVIKKIFAKITAGIFGASAEGGAEVEKENTKESTTSPLELDPDDVNDIISALNSIKFNKYIVLEDFHYLPTETQKDFSVALKAFHEESKYCFIIVGVWLEENRLTVYNGDLTGRVTSINADKWEDNDEGHSHSTTFRVSVMIDNSFFSVFTVTEKYENVRQ